MLDKELVAANQRGGAMEPSRMKRRVPIGRELLHPLRFRLFFSRANEDEKSKE